MMVFGLKVDSFEKPSLKCCEPSYLRKIFAGPWPLASFQTNLKVFSIRWNFFFQSTSLQRDSVFFS